MKTGPVVRLAMDLRGPGPIDIRGMCIISVLGSDILLTGSSDSMVLMRSPDTSAKAKKGEEKLPGWLSGALQAAQEGAVENRVLNQRSKPAEENPQRSRRPLRATAARHHVTPGQRVPSSRDLYQARVTVSRRTPSNTTRTCNKLLPVNWLTRRKTQWAWIVARWRRSTGGSSLS